MDSLFNAFHDVSGMSREQIATMANEAQETIEDLAVGLKGIGGLLLAAANNQDWGSINNQVSDTAILIERLSDMILLCKQASGNLNYHLKQCDTAPVTRRKATSQRGQGGEA